MTNKGINHGFVPDTIVEGDHYILGAYGSLGGAVINPSRDWRNVIPAEGELQNKGFETYCCTTFGTLNAIETLYKYQFGEERNYSDRWLGKASGTNILTQGNSPHIVAETLRNKGDVLEKDWPFDATVKTVQDFFADFPKKFFTLALNFITEFDFKHEWVTCTAQAIFDALLLSPLGFSVYAWIKDENGLYYKPQGAIDGHWVCLVYAVWGQYWVVIDSYADNGEFVKKVRWDALPMQAKRYKLTRQIVVQSFFEKFLALIHQYVFGKKHAPI
jgi:hypothetical protein